MFHSGTHECLRSYPSLASFLVPKDLICHAEKSRVAVASLLSEGHFQTLPELPLVNHGSGRPSILNYSGGGFNGPHASNKDICLIIMTTHEGVREV